MVEICAVSLTIDVSRMGDLTLAEKVLSLIPSGRVISWRTWPKLVRRAPMSIFFLAPERAPRTGYSERGEGSPFTRPQRNLQGTNEENTAFTVQVGHGASIQLVNVVITTGNTRATIQFGSFDFPSVVARAAAVPMTGMNTKRPARKLHPVRPLPIARIIQRNDPLLKLLNIGCI
ncbi:hypothetical protein MA16_Dca019077 [Dendrobium catenatum]|uniref:Uncharacterized protein n=1 Tax=Dendrobium catenatum TaxID=906689 RepID=A0A2I0VU80_9ASPA|nr:hypothetical protein MA16_Dca019077 [Dendrobium catenatum]